MGNNDFLTLRDWLRGYGPPFWWLHRQEPDSLRRRLWVSQITSGIGDLSVGVRAARFHGGPHSKRRPYGSGWDIWVCLPFLHIWIVWVTQPAAPPTTEAAKP